MAREVKWERVVRWVQKVPLGLMVPQGNKGNKERWVQRDPWDPQGEPVPRENMGTPDTRGRKVTLENLERTVSLEVRGRREKTETAEKGGTGVYRERKETLEFRGRVELMVKLAPQDSLENQGEQEHREKRETLETKVCHTPLFSVATPPCSALPHPALHASM